MVAAAVASSGGVTLVVEALSVSIGLHVDLVLASAQPKLHVEIIYLVCTKRRNQPSTYVRLTFPHLPWCTHVSRQFFVGCIAQEEEEVEAGEDDEQFQDLDEL